MANRIETIIRAERTKERERQEELADWPLDADSGIWPAVEVLGVPTPVHEVTISFTGTKELATRVPGDAEFAELVTELGSAFGIRARARVTNTGGIKLGTDGPSGKAVLDLGEIHLERAWAARLRADWEADLRQSAQDEYDAMLGALDLRAEAPSFDPKATLPEPSDELRRALGLLPPEPVQPQYEPAATAVEEVKARRRRKAMTTVLTCRHCAGGIRISPETAAWMHVASESSYCAPGDPLSRRAEPASDEEDPWN